MPLPVYQDLYPVILKNAETPKIADEYLAIVAHEMQISEEDLALRYPSGEGIIRNRLRWAIHYLRRAQLLTKPSRGFILLRTEELNSLKSILMDLGILNYLSLKNLETLKNKQLLMVKFRLLLMKVQY